MQDLEKKLIQLNELLKALKAQPKAPVSSMPAIPKIPTAKPPAAPSLTPSAAKAPKISSGAGPDSKKDPKKVAQQIKDGSMTTKTQKIMLKADSVTGQWYLESTPPASI